MSRVQLSINVSDFDAAAAFYAAAQEIERAMMAYDGLGSLESAIMTVMVVLWPKGFLDLAKCPGAGPDQPGRREQANSISEKPPSRRATHGAIATVPPTGQRAESYAPG